MLGVALATLLGLVLVLHLQERWASRLLARKLGWRSVLLTGWLGVSLHELSHLLLAKLFSHRIVAWRLFAPDPQTGTLGYVFHRCEKRNTWQLLGFFFIGIAPLLTGCLCLALLVAWMTGAREALALGRQIELGAIDGLTSALVNGWIALKALATAIWTARSPWMPLQLYLAACVSLHMAPSRADLKNGARGALALLVCMLVAAALFAVCHAKLDAVLIVLPLAVLVVGVALLFSLIYVGGVLVVQRLSCR